MARGVCQSGSNLQFVDCKLREMSALTLDDARAQVGPCIGEFIELVQ